MKKTALIIGAYGQDGSYLTELLIKKKYFVYGIVKKLIFENSLRVSDNSKKGLRTINSFFKVKKSGLSINFMNLIKSYISLIPSHYKAIVN